MVVVLVGKLSWEDCEVFGLEVLQSNTKYTKGRYNKAGSFKG